MKKFLKTKLALSLALALTMGSFLSVSTSPVMAQDVISDDMYYTDEEAALFLVAAARVAWSTRWVRRAAYAAAGEVAYYVTTWVAGSAEMDALQTYPGDSLD